MGRTLDMFGKTRKKREWLMHVVDCGNSNCCEMEEGEQLVKFACSKCKTESEWCVISNVTAAKRGIPCKTCNKQGPI